ncbi:TPA_asm: UL5.5 dORF [Human alphaherpesvirus 1]|nr:TPA_asm: UL5.5 dORF [Human alphaherpesvirus 1]
MGHLRSVELLLRELSDALKDWLHPVHRRKI